MATIRPLRGIHYASRADLQLSKLISPPYDVLDEQAKAALLAGHPNNIVAVDLPHFPPDAAGPDEAYQKAATTLTAWQSAGILVQDRRPAIYPYVQSFDYNGRIYHRRGFICLVKLEPLDTGHILPHEMTHAGPIEDRLKLMQATGMQLSPVFGLFSDPGGQITRQLYQNLGKPMLDGSLQNVRNQLWAVSDNDAINHLIQTMGTKPIYIADGHHRYTTALQYQRQIEQAGGGRLPASHPANFCMFVLVALQDDGLLILPTHRLIGGLTNFNMAQFASAIASNFEIVEIATWTGSEPVHTFGLYDGRTRKTYKLILKNLDVLKPLEPDRSEAWRRLDVAILQRYLIDQVLSPMFAAAGRPSIGYTADVSQITRLVDGVRYQFALLLRPTPLTALEELGKRREVMPQKSTYFWPKLATGMLLNPLK